MVAQYAASYGLTDELHQRNIAEPLEGNVCAAAQRTCKRLKNMLSTPHSRMGFLSSLADSFGLGVAFDEGGSVHLSLSPSSSGKDCSDRVPNVIQVLDDGTIAPVDYELHDEDGEGDATL